MEVEDVPGIRLAPRGRRNRSDTWRYAWACFDRSSRTPRAHAGRCHGNDSPSVAPE